MISVQIAKGREALESLSAEWESLAAGAGFAAVFSHPAWYLAWLDVFPQSTASVITARVDGRLVGLLPMARIRTDARGMYLSRVAPIAPGMTDYQPPLVIERYAADALPAMLDAAIGRFGRRGVYWWPNVPVASPGLDILRTYLNKRGMTYFEEVETAPRVRLEGDAFSHTELKWTSSHRKDVRRQRKRLQEQGPVSLWQPSTLQEAEPVLEDFFRVHDEKWLSQGFPGIFHNPATRSHFQSMLRRLFGKGLHFSTIRCGDTDVSYHFGFLSGGWLLWYRPSYRQEFSGYSPSKIHVSMLMERGHQLGWQGFDFLLGEEPYKLQWTNEQMKVVSIHAGFHRWAPSYFWFSQGKPYLRQRFGLLRLRLKAKLLQWKRRGEATSSGEPPKQTPPASPE